MTTSCKAIIALALSKLGVAGGTKDPRAEDLNLGLTTLQSLYRQLISSGKLGRANDVVPTEDYTVRENDRVFRTSNCTANITFPELITEHWCGGYEGDYAGWYGDRYYDRFDAFRGKPRPPRDGAFVIINDANSGGTVEYIYDGYVNQWVSVHDLNLQDYQETLDEHGLVVAVTQPSVPPLCSRDLNGLAAYLAVMLADHYQRQPTAMTVRDANAWEGALVNRFGEPATRIFSNFF